mmetsp:Transcript_27031/g.35070  ORF Transcript_27031/g.35070 Transcript_27031/m.35070 type:complete len:150 (+) Transcript_27031:17-466(+)
MEKERVDYIVLDAENAIYADNGGSWDVPDYMFKQYEKDDEIFISLHSCDYVFTHTTPTSSNSVIMIDMVNIKNQENTNNENILAINDNNILLRNNVYYLSSNNNKGHDIKLNVSKFYKVKLGVFYLGAQMDFNDRDYKFILKVSYEKKN